MNEPCYNVAHKDAPAMLQTSGSVAEFVTGLKENKSDMSDDSTPTSERTIPHSTRHFYRNRDECLARSREYYAANKEGTAGA
jgi:hypothetical protein